MGERSHTKNATYYRQEKKRFKTTYEESLLEIKEKLVMILMKTFFLSLAPSLKKPNDEQIRSEGEISKCYEAHNILSTPPIMPAIHPSFNLILTCLVHLQILHILEPSPVLNSFRNTPQDL
jgi:hypothetical protein